MPSRRERSSTPASVRVSTVRITPDRERPRRSSATTTTASPAGWPAGSTPAPPKLTDAQVRQVRALCGSGESISELVCSYGVSRATIYRALATGEPAAQPASPG